MTLEHDAIIDGSLISYNPGALPRCDNGNSVNNVKVWKPCTRYGCMDCFCEIEYHRDRLSQPLYMVYYKTRNSEGKAIPAGIPKNDIDDIKRIGRGYWNERCKNNVEVRIYRVYSRKPRMDEINPDGKFPPCEVIKRGECVYKLDNESGEWCECS